MRRLGALAAALLVAPALGACNDPEDSNTGYVKTANPVRTFAPVVRLAADETALPISPGEFIERSALRWSRGAGCSPDLVAGGRIVERLGSVRDPFVHAAAGRRCQSGGPVYATTERTRPFERAGRPARLAADQGFFLDLRDGVRGRPAVRSGSGLEVSRVPALVTRREDLDGGDMRLRLTYWVLYAREEGDAAHEGDWERLEVVLERGAEDDLFEPASVIFDGDGEPREVAWQDLDHERGGSREATHPVVFAARGSHRMTAEGDSGACGRCPLWRTWRSVREAPAERWYGYAGAWGEPGPDGARSGAAGPVWWSTTPEAAAEMSEDEALIVSIGDSVASGEGNADVPGEEAVWLAPQCRRSLRSGHAQAAWRAEAEDPDVDVAFVPLGCSGATVDKGLVGPYQGVDGPRGEDEEAQVARVNRLAARREIDALLISVGANDVHFAKMVNFCIAWKECVHTRFDPRTWWTGYLGGAEDPTLERAMANALAKLPEGYRKVEQKLSKRIPRDRVSIVEYFDPTQDKGGVPCTLRPVGPIGGFEIDPEEFQWAHEHVLGPLNDVIREAAGHHGWRVVQGAGERFAGHGICVTPGAERWVRTLGESWHLQARDHHGTLHPNARGHLETAELIRAGLAR